MCRITFSPNIVQQARIATNGLLGDFVIRYDVQRDMGIGDIQVSIRVEAFTKGSGFPPHSRFLSSVSGFKRALCPLLRPQGPAGGPQERGVCHRHQRLHAGQEDPPGKGRTCSSLELCCLTHVTSPLPTSEHRRRTLPSVKSPLQLPPAARSRAGKKVKRGLFSAEGLSVGGRSASME